MATACVAGSTGLTGSLILSTILSQSDFSKVYAYTRRDLASHDKQTIIRSSDISTWPSSFPKDATVFFSGLGTTRAQAGGLANQRKIDLDLNLDLAKAAKAAGTKVYVLISSSGANSSSMVPYPKMKGELEDAVQALDFEHCIILRPGLLVGQRSETRTAEGIVQSIARFAGMNSRLTDFWAQDAQVVARAAVAAAQLALKSPSKSKPQILSQADIIRLGRTEWRTSD